MTAPVVDQPTDATGQLRPIAIGLPRVNLLPAEILEIRRFRRVQSALGAAVMAAVLVVAGLWFVADQEAGAQQERLDSASSEQARLNREVATLAPVTETYRQVEEREALLTTALGGEVLWSRYLIDISLTVPEGVWLTSMTVAPVAATEESTGSAAAPADVPDSDDVATITFVGKALDHDDVATWLETQAKQRGFTDVYFSDSKRELVGDTPVYTFTSTVTVTSAALNPQYVAPAGR